MKKLEWDTGDIFLNSLRDKVNEIVDLINVYNCTGGCGNWAPNKRDTVNKLTEDKGETCPKCGCDINVIRKRITRPADNGSGVKAKEVCTLCKGEGRIKDNLLCNSDCYRLCPQCYGAPKPKSLEDIVSNGLEKYFTEHLGINDFGCDGCANNVRDLAYAIRQYIREAIETCLTENDSDTHVIAKDLLERLGIK